MMKKKWMCGLLCFSLAVQPVLPVYAEDLILEDPSPFVESVSEGADFSGEAVFPEEDANTEAAESPSFESDPLGEDLIIEEESSESQEQGSSSPVISLDELFTDEGENGSTTESENEEEESESSLVEETETESLFEEEGSPEEEILVEVEIAEEQDPTVTSAQNYHKVNRIALGQFDGCFGNQLSGNARLLYDIRVSNYVTEKHTGGMTFGKAPGSEWKIGTSPYTYQAELYRNEEGKLAIDKNTEEYLACEAQVKADMQASLDAFLYDHPEVFWLRGGTYKISLAAVNTGQVGPADGYVSQILYTPTVAFEGAEALISDFYSKVEYTAAQIYAGADTNSNGTVERVEVLRRIHDYLCDRLWYDSVSYSQYETTKDYRIFCAAGAFLDSVGTGVVCEGYAKSFKVICDQLGIPCVMIGGTVQQGGSTIGHMWNGVQVDGQWYLLDATWDDYTQGFGYSYFLIGNTLAGRVTNGNFGGSEIGMEFAYPVLSTETLVCSGEHTYGIYHEMETCLNPGYIVTACSLCSKGQVDWVEPLGHDFPEGQVKAPTCTEGGYTTYICSRCGYSYTSDEISALGHDYETSDILPTCTEGGYILYTCVRGDSTYKEESGVPAHGHSYGEDGLCIYCGAGDSIERAVISGISNTSYTGKKITQDVEVAFGTNVLQSGTDYKVSYSDNKKVGTAKVTITGIGNFSGQVTKKFKISRKSVSKLKYSTIQDYTYRGKLIKPSVTVKNGSVKLKKGTDYTISYSSNKAIGKATVKIKGKGSYTGTKKLTFKILPRKTVLGIVRSAAKGALTVSWGKVSGIDGYQIEYAPKSSFKGSKREAFGAGTTSRTITGVKSASRCYVRVRTFKKVGTAFYFSVWSSVKNTTVR